MQKTAIIVPCHNEALRLRGDEFARMAERYGDLHFLFVNDGSTDGTQEILEDLCRRNPPQMRTVNRPVRSGKAEAVRAGFLEAFASNYEAIGYWDADLATPLGLVPAFCKLLEVPGTALVIGSRVRLLGRRIERRAWRHYLGRVYASAASLVTGLSVYDTQCGAKLFRNTDEVRLVFGKPFRAAWTFDVEILARFLLIERFVRTAALASSAVEYPLEAWTDVTGSKLRLGDFVRAALDLGRIAYLLHAPGAERRFHRLTAGASGRAVG